MTQNGDRLRNRVYGLTVYTLNYKIYTCYHAYALAPLSCPRRKGFVACILDIYKENVTQVEVGVFTRQSHPLPEIYSFSNPRK